MPSASFGGGAIRVRTPSGYGASRGRPRTDRDLPLDDGGRAAAGRALVDALSGQDFDVVDRIDLTPRRGRDLEPGGNAGGTVALDVDVAPGEDAVVLLERDGVYSWHLPVHPTGGTRSIEQRSVGFEIEVQPLRTSPRSVPARRGAARRGAARRDRGLLGDLVHGAVQAIVLRFALPAVMGGVVRRLEEPVRPGLVHVTGPGAESWIPVGDELALPTDRPVRLLLLVHGTFSSTIGAFAPMGLVPGAEGFLPTVIGAYDAVLGYDHRTLSVDPLQNARDLLDALRRHHPGTDLTIDIITHSRGGLVTRSFVESVVPQSDWPATVDNIVFVASTHGGTHLADPQRWHDLVDLYTNLVTVGAAGLALVPGGAPVAAVVGGVVRGIGALVKYLVTFAADGGDVPGLAAMIPGGPFVTDLNADQPGQPGPGTSWHVVTSNFHVTLGDDSHRPAEFPTELAVRLGEGFVDGLFKGDNDLVVDVASMSAIGPVGSGYVKDTLDLGTNDAVYHTNYFNQLRVIEALGGWLPLGLGAGGGGQDDGVGVDGVGVDGVGVDAGGVEGGGGPGPSGAESPSLEVEAPGADLDAPPPPIAIPTHSGPRRVAPRPLPRTLPPPVAESPPPPAPPAAPSPPSPAPPSAPSPPAPAPPAVAPPAAPSTAHAKPPTAAEPATPPGAGSPGHLAAEMPAQLLPGTEVTVRVRLGTSPIEASHGAASVAATVRVDPSAPVTIQLVGKRNATVVGDDTRVLGLPQGDWTSDAQFTVTALEPGPVRLTVVARQGWVPVANLTLKSEAVAVASAPDEAPSTARASGAGAFGIDTSGLERLPVLEIFERRVAGGRVVYQYAVRATPRGRTRRFESEPLTRSQQFAASRIEAVADLWRDVDRTAADRFADVQDIGADLFERLFPEEMQAFLWEHRDTLADLLVLTDEPYMPWELVHLKPPRGPREPESRFLAQGGLVRWHFDRVPPQQIRVRPGRARSLCLLYEDTPFALRGPEEEARFLQERFGAVPIDPTPSAVRGLLREGGFDLLHFAGHGSADAASIADARILLAATATGGPSTQEFLSATNVSANARWTRRGEVGPVVVLNACEVGRAGTQLSTVGGFAKAFLDAGAAVFVSCLWSVHDTPSRIFVEALYDALLAGATVGSASAQAREAARLAGDQTWLAYVVYARPDAVLAIEPTTPATPATPEPAALVGAAQQRGRVR